MILHQAGFSPVWSCVRLCFHQGGLASGRVFTKVVLHQDGFSPRWSLIDQPYQSGFLLGWFVIREGFIWMGFYQDGLNLISLIREGFLHHLSSSLIRVAFHQSVVIGHTHNQLSLLLV